MSRTIKRGSPSTPEQRNAEAEACIKALRRAGIDVTFESVGKRMARKLSEGPGALTRYLEGLDEELLERWGFYGRSKIVTTAPVATRIIAPQRYFGNVRLGRRG